MSSSGGSDRVKKSDEDDDNMVGDKNDVDPRTKMTADKIEKDDEDGPTSTTTPTKNTIVLPLDMTSIDENDFFVTFYTEHRKSFVKANQYYKWNVVRRIAAILTEEEQGTVVHRNSGKVASKEEMENLLIEAFIAYENYRLRGENSNRPPMKVPPRPTSTNVAPARVVKKDSSKRSKTPSPLPTTKSNNKSNAVNNSSTSSERGANSNNSKKRKSPPPTRNTTGVLAIEVDGKMDHSALTMETPTTRVGRRIRRPARHRFSDDSASSSSEEEDDDDGANSDNNSIGSGSKNKKRRRKRRNPDDASTSSSSSEDSETNNPSNSNNTQWRAYEAQRIVPTQKAALKRFQRTFGHSNVAPGWIGNPSLAQYVSWLRHVKRERELDYNDDIAGSKNGDIDDMYFIASDVKWKVMEGKETVSIPGYQSTGISSANSNSPVDNYATEHEEDGDDSWIVV